MRPDVVAERAVVPVEEEAVEPPVDCPAGPAMEWLQDWRDRERRVGAAGVVVIGPVGLLPAGRVDRSPVDLDDKVVVGVAVPECLESVRVRTQLVGELPDEEPVAIIDLLPESDHPA